jgi:hypothetical protein
MRYLSERGLSVRDAWTLRTYLVARVGQRVLNYDRTTCRSRPRYRNFFPNVGVIFVHVPKTAGTSVQSFFSQLDQTMEAQGERAKIHTGPRKRDPLCKHSKAPELRVHLGGEIWNSCYRFSFVRNPWDLMVSAYHWWLQKAPQFVGHRRMAAEITRMGDFGTFIRSPYGLEMICQFSGNQLDWINNGSSDYVHYVGRVETLAEDLKHIVEQLKLNNLERLQVPRLNQTRRLDYRSYYDLHTKELVRKRFAREIQRFGYDF